MAGGAPASADNGYAAIPRRALGAAILVISNLMVVIDLTVANVSVPHIAGSLSVSVDQGTWVVTSYAVAEAIAVPLTGWLVERFGAVRVYILAMAGFAAFSLLCGLSLTIEMIILSRIGQGLCGGLLMPLVQTLLMRTHPPAQRNKAMLLFTTTIMIGPAAGPIIGGYISDNYSWHWIFLINLPIAIGCITMAYLVLRPAETKTRKGPIDVVGLALLVFWVSCLQIMLDIGRTHDWFQDPLIVMLAMGAAVGLIVFVIWELTADHPVVDLRIFRHRGFSYGLFAMSLCFGTYFASIVLVPQWLQGSMGYPAMLAGLITAFTALAALTTSPLAGKAINVADPRLLVSFAVFWLGCMSLVRSHWTTGSDFWTLAMPQLVQGFAMSLFMLPLTTISLGSVRPEETASAAGLQNFVRTISMAAAAALALTLMDNTQQAARSELVGNLQPDETMAALTDAGFPAQQALGIISNMVEREAVMIGVDYIFVLSAVAFFVSAVVIWLAPRPRSLGHG